MQYQSIVFSLGALSDPRTKAPSFFEISNHKIRVSFDRWALLNAQPRQHSLKPSESIHRHNYAVALPRGNADWILRNIGANGRPLKTSYAHHKDDSNLRSDFGCKIGIRRPVRGITSIAKHSKITCAVGARTSQSVDRSHPGWATD